MASILCIETSTEVCSVALALEGHVVASREDKSGKNHAQMLAGFVEDVMKTQNRPFNQLDAIAVSGGPGSYTGLRIGVSTAKGLCFASGLPLIAIPSLEAMAHHIISNPTVFSSSDKEPLLYCPMIDARRMEVYTAVYDNKLVKLKDIQAEIIDHHSFASFLKNQNVLFFGNGSGKCKMTLRHPNALFLDDITASASFMAGLAEQAFHAGNFVDVAYYVPFYLKDFVATIPTKNIFLSKTDTDRPQE
jgi:tRNA threonylcarbamoyladenosine biosynthesis protein TsaB